jgi:hypothetical protein
VLIIAAAVVLYAFAGISMDTYALSILLVVIVGFTVTTVQCARFLQSLPANNSGRRSE